MSSKPACGSRLHLAWLARYAFLSCLSAASWASHIDIPGRSEDRLGSTRRPEFCAAMQIYDGIVITKIVGAYGASFHLRASSEERESQNRPLHLGGEAPRVVREMSFLPREDNSSVPKAPSGTAGLQKE